MSGKKPELSSFDLIQLRIFQTLLLLLFVGACVRIGAREAREIIHEFKQPVQTTPAPPRAAQTASPGPASSASCSPAG